MGSEGWKTAAATGYVPRVVLRGWRDRKEVIRKLSRSLDYIPRI
jgi:hypothetical protein